MLGFYNLQSSARNKSQAGTGWITLSHFSRAGVATGLASGAGNECFTLPGASHNLSAKQIWSYVAVIAMCIWLVGAGFLQMAAADYTNLLARSAAWNTELAAQTQSHNSLSLNLGQLPNVQTEAATTQRGTNTSAEAPHNPSLNGITAPKLNPLSAPQQIVPQSSGASLTGSADGAHLGGYIFQPGNTNIFTGVVANQIAIEPASWNSNQPLYGFGATTQVKQLIYHNGSIFALVSDGSLWKSQDGVSWSETYDPVAHSFTEQTGCAIGVFTLTPRIKQIATVGESGPIYIAIGGADLCSGNINNSAYDGNIVNGIYVTTDGSGFSRVLKVDGAHGGTWSGDVWDNYQDDVSGVAVTTGGVVYAVTGPTAGDYSLGTAYYLLSSLDNFETSKFIEVQGKGNFIALPSTYPESFSYAYYRINNRLRIVNNTTTSAVAAPVGDNINVLGAGTNNLWVVDDHNGISHSSDGGITFQYFTSLTTKSGTVINGFETVVEAKNGTVWVGSLYGRVAASTDNGATWTDETGNLASVPAPAPADNLGSMVILAILPDLPDPVCGCAAPSTESPNIPTNIPQVNNFRPNPNTGGSTFSVQGLGQTPPPDAPDLDLSFSASFNSFNTFQPSSMAAGWHHNLDYKLQELPSGAVNIMQPSGRIDSYQPLANGQYFTPRRTDATLVKNGDGSFSLTQLNKSMYSFSTSASGGLISKIQDRNSNFIDFAYNGTNSLTGAKLCLGSDQCSNPAQAITLTYSTGLLTDVSDQAARSIHFGYDSLSRLITITDVRQQSVVLSYTAGNLARTIKDANGNTALTIDYDGGGRLVKYTDALGNYSQFDYSAAGMTIYTDTRQNATTFYYDNLGRTTQVYDPYHTPHSYQYDSRDHTTQFTSTSGAKTYTTYDTGGIGLPVLVTSTVTVDGAFQVYTTSTHYNSQNQPDVITNARGYATHITYDASGNRPALVTDPLGNQTGYVYGDAAHPNRLTAMTTTRGNVQINYSYDQLGYPSQNVETFSTLLTGGGSPTTLQQTTRTTKFTYDSLGRLTDQSDSYYGATAPNPLPHVHNYYDAAGNLLTTTNQLGQTSTTIYDAVGLPLTTTNFMGQQTFYTHDALNRTPKMTSLGIGGVVVQASYATTYDAAGNISTTTNHNGVTTVYTYDNLNRLVQTQTPLQAGGYLTTIDSYDTAGNLASVRRVNSGTGLSGDQTTSYEYDEWNRVVTTTYGVGSLNYKQVTLYDANNNVVATKHSLGAASAVTSWNDPTQVVTTTTQYDPLDRAQSTTILARTTTGGYQNLVTSYAYNDTLLVSTVTGSYGVSSSSQSDGLGRTISQTVVPTSPANGAQVQSSYTLYDANNLTIRTIDPVGNWADSGYDLLHRPTSQTLYTLPGGNGTALTSRTFYTDTVLPQVTRLGPTPYYQRQDTFMDALNRPVTTTIYTGNGNANVAVLPGGALNTSYAYDDEDNLVKLTDSRGNVTQYGYENPDWLKIVTQTVTSGGVLQTLTTTYSYDFVGNLLRTTDANGHTASQISHYDVMNRLTDEYDALGNGWHTYYDGLGRIIGKQDAKGQLTSYYFDNSSRLISFTTAGAITTSFVYNAGSRPLAMVDQVGSAAPVTTTYSYDGLDRLVSVTNPQGVVSYTFDAANRRTGLSFGPAVNPTHWQASYGYDGLSRPLAITNTGYLGTSQVLNYNYNSGPRLAGLNYPNGVSAAYSFDGAGRLTNITQTKGTNTLYKAQYTLDPMGNRTNVSEVVSNTSTQLNYTFDELSRLTQEVQQLNGSNPLTATYTYDNGGNRTAATDFNKVGYIYTYDAADRLTEYSARPLRGSIRLYDYGYDNNDNVITTSQGLTYTYDSRNRLVGWQNNSNGFKASFYYDGANTRTSLSYDITTTTYLQDISSGAPVVLAEGNSTTTTAYLYPLGTTSPMLAAQGGVGAYYHDDGLGSVRALTDASTGAQVGSYSYSAFGTDTGSVQSGAGITLNQSHRFAGEQLDPTGLYYNRARYYDPSLGRFISRDSYSGNDNSPLTQNRYIYAMDNPVGYTDPSGNYACNSSPKGPYSDYRAFCDSRRDMLNNDNWFQTNIDSRTEKNSHSNTQPAALTAFAWLFNDDPVYCGIDRTLPGGSYGEAKMMRRTYMSQAEERMEFVLWYKESTNVQWGHRGLGKPFDDDHYYTWHDPSGIHKNEDSPQLSHFMTGVKHAWNDGWVDLFNIQNPGFIGGTLTGLAFGLWFGFDAKFSTLSCEAGHEFPGSEDSYNSCKNGSKVTNLVAAAATCDMQGRIDCRDKLVEMILPGADYDETNDYAHNPQDGQSREDLRLTIKAWILVKQIREHKLTKPTDIQNWLWQNIGPNAR